MVQPRAAKALDEHTEAKLGYRNAFQHDGLDLETGPGGCLLTVAEMARRE
ncbi:putative methyltransferase-like protein [Pseudomonas aeruginosa]|nr:putative methyltransferase-like protein [Pseudomonas aeruginosa]